MAIMIPSQISDGAPQSEKIIFQNLMRAIQARNWVVFHSEYVDNPNHAVRPREIDFLILTDNCSVICLEVKGGSYEISNREWHRLPDRELVQPSPPEQARTAMFALQKEFTSHFGPSSLLSLGCAIAFTDSQFPSRARKPKQGLIIERPDARNPDRLVKKLADYADNLPTKQVREILDTNREKCMEALEALNNLRSELEKTMIIEPPETIFRSDLETLRPQLLRLTTAQLTSLNRVRINDRCVIDGAAGTGKTVLAMELARQRCEEGETVALLCSNPHLSHRFDRWTKTLSQSSGGKVIAGTPARLPLWAFRSGNALKDKHQERLDNSPELEASLKRGYHLDDKWASFIDETVKDLGAGGVFDYLIVDEAQNLCDETFLKLMHALLKGELTNGRWTMFGDFTYQDIVSPRLTEDGRDVLKNFGLNWSNDELETNCRNTHEIASTVAKLVDIESPPMSGVHGPLVEIKYFTSPKDLEEKLDDLIENWRNRKFGSEQIILLSSDIGGKFNTERCYGGWSLQNISKIVNTPPTQNTESVLIPSDSPLVNTLRYSNVYDFQGLESDLAILVLPKTEDMVKLAGGLTLPRERHLNKILYTGMSRAKAMLVILAHEGWRETLEDRSHLYDILKENE